MPALFERFWAACTPVKAAMPHTHLRGDRCGGLRAWDEQRRCHPQLCDARWDAFAGRSPGNRRRDGNRRRKGTQRPTLPMV